MLHVRAAAVKNIRNVAEHSGSNMKKNTIFNLFLVILSGVLGFLAFPPFDLSLMGWICLIPLFHIARNNDLKKTFMYSYLSGIVFFGSVLYWLVNVSVPGMVILVSVLALFYGLFGISTRYIIQRSMELFLIPLVWVVLEYVRSHIFTGFPWVLLGYSQYRDINIIQIADIAGTYGVSFLVVSLNAALFALTVRDKKRMVYMATAIMFIGAAAIYGVYRTGHYPLQPGAKISIIQGNIPQEHKFDAGQAGYISDKYMTLTKEAAKSGSDIIIWPETAYPYLIENERGVPVEIKNFINDKEIPILAGVIYAGEGVYYNGAVLFDGKDKINSVYKKTHLVPFGEYVPFREQLSFLREYIDKPIGNFESGEEYTLFPVKSTSSAVDAEGNHMRWTDFYRLSVLICFEDTFPYLARKYKKKGADIIVNITNDAWFGKTAAPRQHLQASIFRAVENRVPIVRSANTGISCFIDPFGRITSILSSNNEEIFVTGYLTDNVMLYPARSYYTTYGETFVFLCIFMIIAICIVERFISQKKA